MNHDVVLVYMPFAPVERPSIALGILKETLAESELVCRTIHANVRFASQARLWRYQVVSNRYEFSDLVGEWVFAGAAFPEFEPDHQAYFRELCARRLRTGSVGQQLSDAEVESVSWELRHEATQFVDQLAREIVADKPLIVGCSSAFEQHTASLGLLRRIRDLAPEVVTMLGGANCESEMGWVTHHRSPWVDFVVSGEAETVFPWLCQQIRNLGPDIPVSKLPAGVAAPASREETGIQMGRAVLDEMDRSPVPSYEEYFETLGGSSIRGSVVPGLPVETARGCWWGQIRHCKFCGLNGLGMAYRSKSAQRILEELSLLGERHGIRKFEVVDNILDMSHFESVLQPLAKSNPGYSLFYETKANLQRRHLELLARAGVRWIQPGIESLHTGILKLLDKGNTAAMNVQLLKWARELGIRVSWNMLCDLPGDREEWYETMAEIMPALFHLDAPQGISGVQFVRFSPYQRDPGSYGLELIPNPMCRFVYPWDGEDFAQFAYVFENTNETTHERSALVDEFERPGHRLVHEQVKDWQQAESSAALQIRQEADGEKAVFDTRPCAVQRITHLDSFSLELLEACEIAVGRKSLQKRFRSDSLAEKTDELLQRMFLIELEGKLLSVVLRDGPRKGLRREEFPGGYAETDFLVPRIMEKVARASAAESH